MLTVPEAFLVLALRPDGTVRDRVFGTPDYGLVGAVLVELSLRNRIRIGERGALEVTDRAPTGDGVLDAALERIAAEKRRDARHWVRTLKGSLDHPWDRVAEPLVARGALRREDRRVLWIFPSRRYLLVDASVREEALARVRGLLLGGEPPEPWTVGLVSLLRACGLLRGLFPRDQQKQAERRSKDIVEGEQVGRAVSGVITEMNAVIAGAVAVSAAASASSSSSAGGSC